MEFSGNIGTTRIDINDSDGDMTIKFSTSGTVTWVNKRTLKFEGVDKYDNSSTIYINSTNTYDEYVFNESNFLMFVYTGSDSTIVRFISVENL